LILKSNARYCRVLALSLLVAAASTRPALGQTPGKVQRMTVNDIRDLPNGDLLVTFGKSQRFYKLQQGKWCKHNLRLLRQALKRHRPVDVELIRANSDTLTRVYRVGGR
jgi:hypothetical protein